MRTAAGALAALCGHTAGLMGMYVVLSLHPVALPDLIEHGPEPEADLPVGATSPMAAEEESMAAVWFCLVAVMVAIYSMGR